jgi:glycosyltransferase involved in cell wall biosynthesis
VSLLWAAKSTWEPAIRREHAIAELAVRHGHAAWFLERPRDVRALRESPAAWLRALAGRAPVGGGAVRVVPSAVVVPPHRNAVAERLATPVLARDLRRVLSRAHPRAVIAQTPWQWPAVSALTGVRRILEVTDDWGALLAERRERIDALGRRAAAEADAVILVSDTLAPAFAGARSVVVPNGVDGRLLDPAPRTPPGAQRLVYVGTLSPRVDLPLLEEVLARLPSWRLDLHGQCQYPGRGDAPGEELEALLQAFPDRVAWHGVTGRAGLAAVIDAADVAVVPMRRSHTTGQDSMKLYDYAARGRPIVLTHSASGAPAQAGARSAATAEEFADAVLAAAREPEAVATVRRTWAADNTWEARWDPWSRAVLGT